MDTCPDPTSQSMGLDSVLSRTSQVCTGAHLPPTEDEFFDILKEYFPRVYDMKYLMKFCDLHGGLNKLAEFLAVGGT